MAHSFGNSSSHGSSASNPVTVSFTPVEGSTVLVLMICVGGGTDRTGGAPTFNGMTMVQAGTNQKAAASPETVVEMWYLLNPPIATKTISIPNSGSLTLFTTIATGKAEAGKGSDLDVTNGANGTSTNPTASVTTTANGDIIFSIVGTGAQTWAPSARDGTQIFDTDNGAFGDGEQYLLQANAGAQAMGWTFGTSDDWAIVVAAFKETIRVNLPNYQTVKVGNGMSASVG